MRAEAVLRGMGDRIARENVEAGLSERWVAGWLAEWQATVDGVVKASFSIDDGLRQLGDLATKIRLARHLQELSV